MHQKLFTIMIILTFSLLLLNSANAFIVYLRPPKMIIRLNTSESVERSLTIENRNNITIGINATISGNISEVITFKNPAFDILPNETKTIDFISKANEPGVYSGQIIVSYTGDISKPVTVPSEITIIAVGNPKQDNNIVTILIIVLIVVVIIVLLFKYRTGRKK